MQGKLPLTKHCIRGKNKVSFKVTVFLKKRFYSLLK